MIGSVYAPSVTKLLFTKSLLDRVFFILLYNAEAPLVIPPTNNFSFTSCGNLSANGILSIVALVAPFVAAVNVVAANVPPPLTFPLASTFHPFTPFVLASKAVPFIVELALKAPAVVIVRAFTPAEANVNPVPNNVALELIFPSALTAPLAEIIPKVLVLPSSHPTSPY